MQNLSSPASGISFHVKRMGNKPMTNRRLLSSPLLMSPIPKTPCHIDIPYFKVPVAIRVASHQNWEISKPAREYQCFTIIGDGCVVSTKFNLIPPTRTQIQICENELEMC